MKLNDETNLTWIKTKLNLNELDNKNAQPLYNSKSSVLESIGLFITEHKSNILIIIIVIIIAIAIRYNNVKKKKIPDELVVILYDNFFNSLTIIEKELIEALYQHNLKDEELSTKTINKIIGVQQKDTLTQNKSRSDHFIKINQKFKMSTQNTESLFIKTRDSQDKRQYNYSLNPTYIHAIEKLLKA